LVQRKLRIFLRLASCRRLLFVPSGASFAILCLVWYSLTLLALPGRAVAQVAAANKPADSSASSYAYSDPLAPLNEKFFKFNLELDNYVTRPVSKGWAKVAPLPVRKAIGRFFDNINVIPRFANNLFQLKFKYAGEEVARFLINTTVGLAGFFDPADSWFGLKEHPQDFGITLGYYGVGMGPYLMIPFFGPFDLRDGVGYLVDGAMNPIDYLLSLVQVVYIYTGVIAASSVNYESQHLDLFEDADRYSVDLYGAVQDAYIQRRQQLLRQALEYNQKKTLDVQPNGSSSTQKDKQTSQRAAMRGTNF